jgi:hypothetical protein
MLSGPPRTGQDVLVRVAVVVVVLTGSAGITSMLLGGSLDYGAMVFSFIAEMCASVVILMTWRKRREHLDNRKQLRGR